MIRAFGAIPTITARQIATASLAVPKSVMKTIVGCATAFAAWSVAERSPHPISDTATIATTINAIRTRTNCITPPLK